MEGRLLETKEHANISDKNHHIDYRLMKQQTILTTVGLTQVLIYQR